MYLLGPPSVDPLQDLCSLVFPSVVSFSVGPWNRARAERAFSWFDADARTKGRFILIDDDMIPYLVGDPEVEGELTQAEPEMAQIPERLAVEQANARNGSDLGRLMKQERDFYRLMGRNIWGSPLSHAVLQHVEREMVGNGPCYMCYCRCRRDCNEQLVDILECSHAGCEYGYFHRSCVKDQGIEEVTQWYCNVCDAEMRILAQDTLVGTR
jgi:hypothetical protein